MARGVAGVMPAELWGEPERRRLVRLCAALSRDRDAAEDLAQETLVEAWRNAHKLHDPAGTERWLAAIARNVCRRWARRRGREKAVVAAVEAEATPQHIDLEVELERAELVELLDRALGELPPVTRDVLVERYVDESSHAEIGARLGLSEAAVSMRLSRGKVVLRRALGPEAGTHGDWRETRVWCRGCGRRRLLMRRDEAPGAVSFRCPSCSPRTLGSEFRLGNPSFARLLGSLVRPTAILARTAEWSRRYFAAGAGGSVDCTRCGRVVTLGTFVRDRGGRPTTGLFAECRACGEQVSTSIDGLALALPETRSFDRDHPRSRVIPQREVDHGGVPALVVRRENLAGSRAVDVVFARDTLRVLEVATG